MPATSCSLTIDSTSCAILGFESKQQQAAWFAQMCRFPFQNGFGINLIFGLKMIHIDTCSLNFLAVASDIIF